MTEINEEILEIHSKNKMKNKGIDMDDRGDNDLEKTIDTLRSRIKELMSMLKRDNKSLAKQIGDYFNAR